MQINSWYLPQAPSLLSDAQNLLSGGASMVNDAEKGYQAYKNDNWGSVLSDASNFLGDAGKLLKRMQ